MIHWTDDSATYVWYAKGMNKDGANLRYTICGLSGPCDCKCEPFPYKCSCVIRIQDMFLRHQSFKVFLHWDEKCLEYKLLRTPLFVSDLCWWPPLLLPGRVLGSSLHGFEMMKKMMRWWWFYRMVQKSIRSYKEYLC